jgi:SAM-dependent methyltransferase
MHVHKEFHEDNRLSWNEATVAHNSHKGDQAAFFRNGGTTLYPEELELLGDLQGRSLVHLQCNSGQDTLSLARLGANVTGVDISDTAIDFARQLSHDTGIPATFHRMDVYDWLEQTARGTQRFDIAFCSYGAIVWLSDIQAWARGIAAILKPGGRFVIIDFHPVTHLFEWNLERKYSYFMDGKPATFEEGIGDYVALSGQGLVNTEYVEGVKDFKNPHRVHEFTWGLGEIVTALLESGLTLTSLREYPYGNGFKRYESMSCSGRRWYLSADQPNIPLMFSISARK